MNTFSYCRICLKTKDPALRNLEETTQDDNTLKSLLFVCTSINIDDDSFSRYICTKCEADLLNASTFRTLATKSLAKLKNWFQNAAVPVQVKVEIEEEEQALQEEKIKLEIEARKDRICPGCGMRFEFQVELNRHMDKLKDQQDHQYHCLECGKHFTQKCSIRVHMILHRKENNRFACDQCDKKYTQSGSLASHKRIEHAAPGEAQLHFCPTCGKGFKRPQVLSCHIRYKHLRTIVAVCEVCSKGFVTRRRLELHKRMHTRERPYQCDVCSKTYVTRSGFDMHRRTAHTDERNHPCDLCELKFKHPHHLKVHRLRHFQEPQFACSSCPSRFRTKLELLDHNNRHTGVRPYCCDTCQVDFHEKAALKRHIKRLHSGITYDCKYCDKKFLDKSTATNHLSSHGLTERNKICSFEGCGKAFYRNADVNRHEREVHLGIRKMKNNK